jgi:hypothetical protein
MKKKKAISTALAPEYIARQIYIIRGQKAMLDTDLAILYGISTKQLNQAVKRNSMRFPDDFMLQLTEKEEENLRSQIVTSNAKRGGRKYLPYAFTEQGVAMLSSVLRSERAVQMNITIIRAFVQLRNLLASNKDLAARMEKLEAKQTRHSSIIEILAEEISALKSPPPVPAKRRIGYV